jgi:hypothetical protein
MADCRVLENKFPGLHIRHRWNYKDNMLREKKKAKDAEEMTEKYDPPHLVYEIAKRIC